MGFMKVLCVVLFALGSVCGTVIKSTHDKTYQGPRLTSPSFTGNVNNHRSTRSRAQRETLEVKHFYLWTRSTQQNKTEVLDPSDRGSLYNSTFRAQRTFVIIHGFLGWGLEDWILQMKEKLLKVSDSNVIAVDWPAGSTYLDYYIVVHRVAYVAKDVEYLIKTLVDKIDLNLKDVHIIGHSLGAHIAGLSSKAIPKSYGKYGRITGLDPAGLLYHQVGPDERLDRSDADYVDIIHTNGCNSPYDPWLSCYGLDEIIGHADFWPNGGKYQPACKEQFKGDIGCDHMMSYRYFMESVDYGTNDTFFLARNCTDWQSYKVGNCSCGRYAQYMGLYSNIRLHGRFYLITNSSSPYAVRDAACAPGTSSGVSILLVGVTAGSAMLVTLCTALIVLFILKRKSSGTKAEEPDGSYSPDGGSNLNYNDDDDALLIGTQDNESDDSSLRIDEDDSGLSEDSREALIVA